MTFSYDDDTELTVYRKDLADFVTGLDRAEKLKKRDIERAARALEEAGTVELHKISARIKSGLSKKILQDGRLSKKWREQVISDYCADVERVLDEKYKSPEEPMIE